MCKIYDDVELVNSQFDPARALVDTPRDTYLGARWGFKRSYPLHKAVMDRHLTSRKKTGLDMLNIVCWLVVWNIWIIFHFIKA
jgi:hypothetical protein